MILIMAIWMKPAALWAYRSKSLAMRLFVVIQASVRSTIQRLGRTTKPFAVSEQSNDLDRSGSRLFDFVAGIGAVSKDDLKEWKARCQPVEQAAGTVSVLYARRMHVAAQQ